METKTLELSLGGIRPLQAQPQEYAPGWYVDPESGQPVYYDGETRTFYTLSGGIYIPLGYMNPAPKQVSPWDPEKGSRSASLTSMPVRR